MLFVFVDGDEVAQGEYAWSLVALLGAPIVGGVALAIAGLALAGPRRRITPAEPPD